MAARGTAGKVAVTLVLLSLAAIPLGCSARSELEVRPLCTADATVSAELKQLDAFIMLDSSGSMDFPVPGPGSRWAAVRSALASFFAAPGSAGMGVSLSMFPVIDQSVPEACVDDASCGVQDACQPRPLCLPSGGGLCNSDEDCTLAGFVGDNCQETGPVCQNRLSCEAQSYTSAVVALAQLPDAQTGLLAALDEQARDGGTPTLPALRGVVQQAKEHAGLWPDHETIVILAGDGLPTACDPALQAADPQQAVKHLEEVAADAAAAGVRVFVIGVAIPEVGTTKANLDGIAKAGDSGSAYIAASGPALSAQLLAAFNDIRFKSEEACVFSLDHHALAVEHAEVALTTADGQRHSLPFRQAAEACGTEGGFYTPSGSDSARVALCPASCALFGIAIERRIEVRGPCQP